MVFGSIYDLKISERARSAEIGATTRPALGLVEERSKN